MTASPPTRRPPWPRPALLLAAAAAAAATLGASPARAEVASFSVDPTRVELAGAPGAPLRFTLRVASAGQRPLPVDVTLRAVAQRADGTVQDLDPSPELARSVSLLRSRALLRRGQPEALEVEVRAPRSGVATFGLLVASTQARGPQSAGLAPEGPRVRLRFRYLVLVKIRAARGYTPQPALELLDLGYDADAQQVRARLVSGDPYDRQVRVEAELIRREGLTRSGRTRLTPSARAQNPGQLFSAWPGASLDLAGAVPVPAEPGLYLLRATLEVGSRRTFHRVEVTLPGRAAMTTLPASASGGAILPPTLSATELTCAAPAGAARLITVEVRNRSARPLALTAIARQGDDPVASAEAWLEVTPAEMTLAAGAARRVGIVVRVPGGTPPGDYEAWLEVAPRDAPAAPGAAVRLLVTVSAGGAR